LIAAIKSNAAPGSLFSVAALSWSDRAYLNAYQDWRYWLESEQVDGLCLMTYTADNSLLKQQLRQAIAFRQPGQFIFGGIGVYKLKTEAELRNQVAAVTELADPCYFCANQLLSPPFDHFASNE